jgi:glycosyltransferase involved in cell wall biosynthesis
MGTARRALEEFRPDILHLTGLNDVSIIAAYLAYKMQITLVGSWHTNLHEFAARRLNRLFSFLPQSFLNSATSLAEQKILDGAMLYYKMPKIVLAPNQELVDLLRRETGREARLMTRGVDTELYSPAKRTVNDGILRIGTVGRLQAEKNVRMLAQMEHALLKKGRSDFKFLIVGEGYERQWLEQNMKTAEFTGFLQGEQLSAAYANMDIFVFPSETDAFGNVTQEALASGVPALVSDKGGPKFIVREGETGFVCKTQDDYVSRAIEFMEEPEKLARMKKAARDFALTKSWDAVFEALYDAYARAMQIAEERRALVPAK